MTLIRGAGGGKGGGGSRTPTEADDSLSSVQHAVVLDLIGEGEIQGLDTGAVPGDGEKSIYLDGTPVRDTTGNPNFEGYTCIGRTGTQSQSYISDLPGAETEVAVSTQVKKGSPGPIVRTITDTNTDRVRVTLRIPSLQQMNNDGDILGFSVHIKIHIQYNGGGYTEKVNDVISGKSSSTYQRDYVFSVGQTRPLDIKFERVSDDETSAKKNNLTYWSSYTRIQDEKFRYPNSALCYLRFDSRSFSNIPKRKYLVRGLKIQLPSNASVDTTTHLGRVTYSGTWDGSFGAAQWCSDPAWCTYALLKDTRWGAGIPVANLSKWDFYSLSQYCNGLVSDGFGSNEPRFSMNLIINTRKEVFNVIQEMLSLFRGISYYSAGGLSISQDKPTDSQYLVGPSNVVNGAFSYSGTSQRSRHTTATVAYQDYKSLGEIQYEYVELADQVSKYGIINKDIRAIGCYSQGQAHRFGKWVLLSEANLTETVNFSVSIESGLMIRPGMVIDVADPLKAGSRRSGRVTSATATAITIDTDDDLSVNLGNSPEISVMLPTGMAEKRTISNISGRVITASSAFSEAPNPGAVWLINTSDVLAQQYRVVGIEDQGEGKYAVTALLYNSSIYAAVDSGADITQRDISNLSAAPDPVSNIQVDEFLYQQGQGVFVGVHVSWDTTRTRVSEFRVQYRINEDNWTTLTTTAPSVTLRAMRAGTLHLQVSAFNYLNKGSTIVTHSQSLAGKTAAPENVSGLMMIPSTSSMARLFWNQCADLDVIVGGWVRLRHSPDTSNVTWATATSIHADLPGSAKEAYCDLKGGTYLAKFVDAGGRESVTETLVEFTKPDLEDMETVNTQTEHSSFPGTKTNLAVDTGTGELRMATDGGTEGGNATFHTTGTYLFQNNPIDLGDVYSVRLNSTLKVRSYFPYNPFVDTFADWDDLASVDGSTPAAADVKLYLRTTQVASPSSDDWTSWRLFHNAEFSARKYELKAECSTGGSLEQIAIQQLKVETLALSRTTSGSGTTSTSADVTITFPNKFLGAPAVGITFSTSQSGDYYTIASTSTTAFAISIYNASGTRQARTFRWTATGYGKG